MYKKIFFLIAFLLLFVNVFFAQNEGAWFENGTHGSHLPQDQLKKMPLIQVKGNKFVDQKGNVVQFRGIAISDPDKVEKEGYWNKTHFEKIKELGANIVRIPIHPVAWRERTSSGYLKMLDQAVEWCTDLGMYVILDWHTIGNLEMEMFQDPMYITTKAETYDFWKKISQHFSGHNTVAFYELFNEPTTYRGQLGVCTWSEWKKLCENMITVIRAFDKETIPLVAGFDWAYDLTPLLIQPISAQGIAYSVHPYPFKRSQPWEPKWDENFGFAAENYPLFATEFGFDAEKNGTIDFDGDNYGNRIISYLENKDIGWCVWVFDPHWGGAKIKSWNYDLTQGGLFFKKAMQGRLKVQKK